MTKEEYDELQNALKFLSETLPKAIRDVQDIAVKIRKAEKPWSLEEIIHGIEKQRKGKG